MTRDAPPDGHGVPAPDRMPARYVYGLTRPRTGVPDGTTGVGTPPASVSAVRHRDVAALVSRAPGAVATREDVLAHARVLERVVVRGAVLPLRFGTTMANDDAVVDDLLVGGYDRWDGLLERYRDAVELRVRGFFDISGILELIAGEPEVRRLRSAGSIDARLRLGAAVARSLEARRAAVAARVDAELAPLSLDVRHGPAETEDTAVDAAFLVARGRVRAFDHTVAELVRGAGPHLRLRCLGPQAPFAFVAEGG